MRPSEGADGEHRRQRHHRDARQPQVEGDHPLAEVRHVEERDRDASHGRGARRPEDGPLPGMRRGRSGSRRRARTATPAPSRWSRTWRGKPPGPPAKTSPASAPSSRSAKIRGNAASTCSRPGIQSPAHDPQRDIAPHDRDEGGGRQGRRGAHVPLAAGSEQAHRLRVVDDAVGGMHRDPPEQHQGQGRARPLDAAVAEDAARQVRVDCRQTQPQARPAADLAPDDPPERARGRCDQDGLHRVRGHHGPQPPRWPCRSRRAPRAQPPATTRPHRGPVTAPSSRNSEKAMLPHHVGALLDLHGGAEQAQAGTETRLEVLGVGEEPRAINGHEDDSRGEEPADRQAQPPRRQVRDPVLVRSAHDRDEVAAVDGRREQRQSDGRPRQLARGELPLGHGARPPGAQPAGRDDRGVRAERASAQPVQCTGSSPSGRRG